MVRMLPSQLRHLFPLTGDHDMTELIVVNDDTTRQDLIDALGYLNATAQAIRRKGYTGTASAA